MRRSPFIIDSSATWDLDAIPPPNVTACEEQHIEYVEGGVRPDVHFQANGEVCLTR